MSKSKLNIYTYLKRIFHYNPFFYLHNFFAILPLFNISHFINTIECLSFHMNYLKKKKIKLILMYSFYMTPTIFLIFKATTRRKREHTLTHFHTKSHISNKITSIFTHSLHFVF